MKKRLLSVLLVFAITVSAFSFVASAEGTDYTVTALSCTNGSLSLGANKAKEGDTVEVTVTPNSGYIPKAGSVIYTYNNGGTVTKALVNRVSDNAAGNKMKFTMPAANVSVYAEFVSTESNNFSFDIVGSSVRKSGETFTTGGFDGIRFVSRLYYSLGSRNANTGVITLNRNGVSSAVSEIGFLYAPSSALGTNSLDYSKVNSYGIVKHTNYSSSNPLSADLLDITVAYVDFAATIIKTENISDVDYTAKAYIKFADGSIEYSSERTDFADNVAQRLGLCSTDDTEGKVDVNLTARNDSKVNGDFGGFGAVMYPWTVTTSNGTDSAAKAKARTEIDRMQAAGIKKVRIIFPVLQVGHYDFDKKAAKTIAENDWFAQLWVEMLNYLKARDIEVMINYSWGNSIQTLSGGSLTTIFPTGSNFQSLNLTQQITAYGQLCAAYTDYFLDHGCTNVKSITFFSEPGNGWKTGSNNYQTKQLSAQLNFNNVITTYGQCVASVKNQLTALGIADDVSIVSGNISMLYDPIQGYDWWNLTSWNNTTILPGKNWFKTMLGKTNITNNSNSYTYHYYGKFYIAKQSNYNMNETALTNIANNAVTGSGKNVSDIVMDEVSVKVKSDDMSLNNKANASPFEATQLAEYLALLMNKGYKGAYLWTFSNLIEANEENMFGLMPSASSSDTTPYNRYYAFSLISKYMNNCNETYRGSYSDGCITAYGKNSSTGKRYIMIVNLNNVSKTVKFSFYNAFAEGFDLYRHIYNPSVNYANAKANVIGADKTFAGVTGSFIDTLPAGAVAIYTSDNS